MLSLGNRQGGVRRIQKRIQFHPHTSHTADGVRGEEKRRRPTPSESQGNKEGRLYKRIWAHWWGRGSIGGGGTIKDVARGKLPWERKETLPRGETVKTRSEYVWQENQSCSTGIKGENAGANRIKDRKGNIKWRLGWGGPRSYTKRGLIRPGQAAGTDTRKSTPQPSTVS